MLAAFIASVVLINCASAIDDAREPVKLPPMMREHMLGNMRDHLMTLDQILGAVADAKYDDAAKLAEARLGMSSLTSHDAAHMAPFMPKPMQEMGTPCTGRPAGWSSCCRMPRLRRPPRRCTRSPARCTA
jgi:hypothetical protein